MDPLLKKRSEPEQVNRRNVIFGMLRGACAAVIAYITGFLAFRCFSRKKGACRSYTECSSCRSRKGCSLLSSAPRRTWRVAEDSKEENDR